MPEATHYSPIYPNGDAHLRLEGDIAAKMDTVFAKTMLPDGNFAVTDGLEGPNGNFNVYADVTGQHIADSLVRGGEHHATVHAYGQRLDLVARPEKFAIQTIDRGESRKLEAQTEALLVNGTGELGKPNLLGVISHNQPDLNRTYGLVELQGRLFAVIRADRGNGGIEYFPQEISTDNPTKTHNLPFTAKFAYHEGQSLLGIASDGKHQTTLHVPNAERTHEQAQTGIIRGILAGKRNQQKTSAAVDSFDVAAAETVINQELESQKVMQEFLTSEASRKKTLEAQQKAFSESISIEKLSKNHPEAGNIFRPGASIYEDDLFIDVVSKFGLGRIEQTDKGPRLHLGVSDQITLRNNPEARKALKEVIRGRIDAWAAEDPATKLKWHFGADRKLETHEAPIGVKRTITESDSLLDNAFSERRTVANLVVPEGIRTNRNKASSKANRREDDPTHLSSRQYATNVAFDMLVDDFDYNREERMRGDVRYIDPNNKVIIHNAEIAQHRTAAALVVYGEV